MIKINKSPKNIAIDCRCLNMAPYGGAGVYTRNLVKNLLNIDNFNKYTLIVYNKINDFSASNVQQKVIPIRGTVFNMIWKVFPFPPFDYFFSDSDIFFSPNFTLPVLSSKIKKAVVSIHDLAFMKFNNIFTKRSLSILNYWVPKAIKKSDAIICISNSTEKDINELFPISRNKSFVTYLACDDIFFQPINNDKPIEVRSRYNLPEKYILFHGTIEPRKNLVQLIKAYNKSSAKSKGIKLVLSGKKGWLSDDVFEAIENLNLKQDVITLGLVPIEDLPIIYKECLFFVYPSIYEGFGIPPLEAMACGKAVITSNRSSLPEVAGKDALYCDPENIDSIRLQIDELTNNNALRENLETRGPIRAKTFSWKKTAEQTLQILLKNL